MNTPIMLGTLLFGFIFGFYLYEVKRFKVGGVIAIPILVIYSLQDMLILPIFIVSTIACLVFARIIAEKTLLYGRRLLYCFLAISIIATSIIIAATSQLLDPLVQEIIVFTIFPGIIAYNISKESYDINSAAESTFLVIVYFAVVYLFARSLLFLTGAGGFA
jgi:hypothetical protein